MLLVKVFVTDQILPFCLTGIVVIVAKYCGTLDLVKSIILGRLVMNKNLFSSGLKQNFSK